MGKSRLFVKIMAGILAAMFIFATMGTLLVYLFA